MTRSLPSKIIAALIGCTLLVSDSAFAHVHMMAGGEPGKYLASHHDPWTPNFAHPDFAAGPIVESIKNGVWSDATVWSGPVNPNTVLRIRHEVLLNTSDEVGTVAVYPQGHLKFDPSRNLTLKLTHFIVADGGELTIGDEVNPIQEAVVSRIIFRDMPINTGTLGSPGKDPGQYGNGLISLGKISVHGMLKTPTFVRVAAEPKVGNTSISLEEPVAGWRAGDRIVLPDTRHLRWNESHANYVSQNEELVVASVSGDGRTISLTAPLMFNHLGARDGDGNLDFLPHVGNLSRNVVFESENPLGVRGHIMLVGSSQVNFRYALMKHMGRTKFDPLDSATFNTGGVPTKIGTNQIGRYPLHMHHLSGPVGGTPGGYQFTVIGNAIDNGTANHKFKWGIAVHDSHFGLIRQNVVYNEGGAGIVTEDGSETKNVFEKNFVVRVTGSGDRGDGRLGAQDFAHDGVGFWFRGTNNYIRDNVAASIHGMGTDAHYGYKIFPMYIGDVAIPNFPGASHDNPGEFTKVQGNGIPVLEFARNEVYGAQSGLTYWWVGSIHQTPAPGVGESVFKDTKMWNVYNKGIFNYPSNKIVHDGLIIRGTNVAGGACCGTGFVGGDYTFKDSVIRNADIQGMNVAIMPSVETGGGIQTIENSYLRSTVNIAMGTMHTSAYRSDWIPPRVVKVINTKLEKPAGAQNALAISMNWVNTNQDVVANLIQADQLLIYNHNGVAGKNYQVFYKEQHPDTILPQSTYNADNTTRITGSPEAGLTNQQNFNKYGIAAAGEIAPCSNATCSNALNIPDINGYVFPAVLPPTLRFTYPQTNQRVGNGSLTVTYQKLGDLAGVDHVHLKLDNQAEVMDMDFDGSYTFNNVGLGAHTVTGYLVRANHTKIDGTDAQVSFIASNNQSPVVSAGSDFSAAVSQPVTLDGSVSDDGNPVPPGALNIAWTKVSGPGAVVFSNASSARTIARFSEVGAYVLRLSANDGDSTTSDEVNVSVSANPVTIDDLKFDNVLNFADGDKNIEIRFPLAANSKLSAKVFTRQGQFIKTLHDGTAGPGEVLVSWTGDNDEGKMVASGVYLLNVNADGTKKTYKLVLIK